MDKLTPIELEDGSVIYIEGTEDVDTSNISYTAGESEEQGRTKRGISAGNSQTRMMQSFQAIESTIRTYTTHTLKAFKAMSTENITKVTLEFGLTISGEGGIPFITKGSAESNLKITVECEFRQSETTIVTE